MDAAPPKIPRRRNRVAALIFSAVALAIAAFVFFFNPATHNFYPVCLFHRCTGLNCPGCGMTRALYALLHGNFSAALRDNALFVMVIFLLAARGGWLVLEKMRGQNHGQFFPAQFLWPLLFAALVFGVLRNLPAFSFLSPN